MEIFKVYFQFKHMVCAVNSAANISKPTYAISSEFHSVQSFNFYCLLISKLLTTALIINYV